MSEDHQRVRVYDSNFCEYCSAWMGSEDKKEGVLPQVIPITPTIYATYLCSTCFVKLSPKEVADIVRTYLNSEDGVFKEQLEAWKNGALSFEIFQYLEHSIRFLRGWRADAPFECAIFVLHERYIKGNPPIRYRKHLALVSFD
jgi:hypothetical protein